MKRRSRREDAVRVTRYLGCRGVHQDENGNWMPCSNPQSLMRISNRAEGKSSRRKKKKRWENLRQRGVMGISTLPGGGLVSERISMAKALMTERRLNSSN